MNALLVVLMAASAAAAPQKPGTGPNSPPTLDAQVVSGRPAAEVGPSATAIAAVQGPPRYPAPEQVPDDPRHRIEIRFGVWRNPHFSFNEPADDIHTGSADFALGFEYLRAVSRDVSVGIGTIARVRGSGEELGHGDSSSTGGTTVAIPLVVRWDFARRLTSWRAIEPYVAGNVGPLVRADWVASEVDHDTSGTSDAAVTLGARLAVGFDAHVGSVWTLGVQAGWNWSDKPRDVIGYGRHDRGGEVAVTMGWVFGRRGSW